MRIDISPDKAAFDKMDVLLSKIDANLRGSAINNGLRAIGRQIASGTKAALPKPGYERFTRPKGIAYKDKSEPKPLGQTVKTKIIQHADGLVKVAIIGYEWPAGAHGHLVEMGHDLVKGGNKSSGGQVIGHVEPAEYMVTVVANSRSQHDSIMWYEAAKLIKVK